MEQAPHHVEEEIAHEEIVEEPGATWQALEYHHKEKTRDWFLGLAMITITIAVISVLLGDSLFAIVILLSGFALALVAQRPPRTITIQMGTRGILIDKSLFLYNELDAFWIEVEENPAHPKILFKSKRLLMPYVIAPLGDMDPNEIGDFLAHFLPEIEQKEPLLQRLLEDFGF